MKHVRGVYERDKGSGAWWICWFDQFGRRHRESIGPRQLAIDAYRKRKTEVREGKLFPAIGRNGISFGDLCRDFKLARPNHWSGGMLDIAQGWFNSRPASAISPQQIEERLNKLIDDGRTPATANRYRAIISAIYSWGMRNNRAIANPARLISSRREHNSRTRFLSDKEEARLRRSLRALCPRREPELDLALHTGMRKGEQYGLEWRDVNWVSGFITLAKTKSGRVRHIPMNEPALKAMRLLQKYNRGRVCGPATWKWFYAALKRGKVKDFRWHDLRHTFASRLAMRGADIRALQELLGHSNIQMTMRYAHLMPGRTADIVKLLSPCATTTATSISSSNLQVQKSRVSA